MSASTGLSVWEWSIRVKGKRVQVLAGPELESRVYHVFKVKSHRKRASFLTSLAFSRLKDIVILIY